MGFYGPSGLFLRLQQQNQKDDPVDACIAVACSFVIRELPGGAGQRDEHGRRLAVRNGFHAERTLSSSAGAVQVKAPRVNDRRVDPEAGERRRFSSAILPPWARKTPKVSEVLPLLYLHGLSTGDFVPALEQFLGSASGLSSATVSRLTTQWQDDHAVFQARDLSTSDFVYVWADGVHLKIRLQEAKACVLVLIGVQADGRKELIAMDTGYRKSGESWASLLRDAARRGMRAPVLAVGDGTLGFWKALREVFPTTREQRCWVHETANALDSLPKSAQQAVKAAIAEIYNAEDKELARAAIRAFERQHGARFPRTVKKITEGEVVLLAFLDYPPEHWIHLRTTNPIESSFSTVRLRTKVTRGAGSRLAALAMTFSSSNPPGPAGAWSTPRTWSPSCAPEPVSSAASSSSASRPTLPEAAGHADDSQGNARVYKVNRLLSNGADLEGSRPETRHRC